MQAHEKRVIDEKKELDKKLSDLETFMGSDELYTKLNTLGRQRLRRQAGHMEEYSGILGDRIGDFPPPRDYGYGNCPKCGAAGISRERRMDGNDQCANRHVYPSKEAVQC